MHLGLFYEDLKEKFQSWWQMRILSHSQCTSTSDSHYRKSFFADFVVEATVAIGVDLEQQAAFELNAACFVMEESYQLSCHDSELKASACWVLDVTARLLASYWFAAGGSDFKLQFRVAHFDSKDLVYFCSKNHLSLTQGVYGYSMNQQII